MENRKAHTRARPRVRALSAAVALGLTTPAFAQDTIEEVIVTGHPLGGDGLVQPALVLDSEALDRALAANIGDTLVGQPAINSSTYGPAVGRPVIRGQAGPRVKTMQDRIDTLDVSVSSPDHAVTVDAFNADAIEVLMGPSTLLYGSGAIGGVVNVDTGRLPDTVPDEVEGRAEIRGADNADRRSAAGRIDGGAGNFAFHADGFYRDADEYDIPGFAESAALRAMEEEEEHGDEDHEHEGEHGEEGEEEAFGVLPGSQFENYGGALGLSYVGETGFFGVSVSSYRSEYGLPGGHGHHEHGHEDEDHEDEHDEEHEDEHEEHEEHEEHDEEHGEEEEEGNAMLNQKQTRVDVEWGQQLSSDFLKSLNLRVGWNDYEHTEFEPNGEQGTRFKSEAMEGRFELVHTGAIEGAFGAQLGIREFSALGEEAFVEPVDTDSYGLFYVGQFDRDVWALEFGARGDRVEHTPASGPDRSFSLFSGSIGALFRVGDYWTLRAQYDNSSRAPVAEELYSDGAHLATNSYEIGDPNLDEETANNLSLGAEFRSDRWVITLNAYTTDFDGFIYESPTGEEIEELPVLQWQQDDATFVGADASARWQAVEWSDGGALALNATVDYVKAELTSGDETNLPRIPPLRWSLGATLNWKGLNAALTYMRVDEQTDIAPNELPTESFDDLRLYAGYSFQFASDNEVEIFLSGLNLTDDEQRYHTSFIKDFAPQPGRTIEAGVRVIF